MEKLCLIFLLGLCIYCGTCDRNKPEDNDYTLISDTAAINSSIRYATSLLRKKPDDAVQILSETLNKSTILNYTQGIGNSYVLMGTAWFYKYNYDSAIHLHNKAFQVFDKINNTDGMALALYSMSYDYSLIHNLEKSLVYAERAKQLYEKSQNYIGAYDCLEALTYIHRQLQHEQDLDSLMKVIVVTAEKTGDSKKIANSYYNLGSHYINQAYLNLAIDAFFKSLKIAEESGDSIEIANALGSVGLANLYHQDYKAAISYYKQQEFILLQLHNDYELSNTYSNVAEAYSALGDYHTCLHYHFKALDLRKKMKFDLALSNSIYNIGSTYLLMNTIDSALQYALTSLEIDRRIKNYVGLAKNNMLLGKIELSKNRVSRGIDLLELSVEFATKYNFPEVLLEASGLLSQQYVERKEYNKAFEYLYLNNQISDSIINSKNVKRITQLEMQHAFDKSQNEMAVQHVKEKLSYETKLKRDRLVLTFSIILGSLIILMGSIIYRLYLKSRKANNEKEYLLKEIHHRVKNNLMIISSLLNLQSGSIVDEGTRSAVKESQNRVKSMALIHQLLYQTEKFSYIEFPKYLNQLMESLQDTYRRPGKIIEINIDADDIKLDIDTAIPLGLITNEIATNAYKYAFVDSTYGMINIAFKHLSDHSCELRISDNGVGLPHNFNPGETSTLGLKLVKLLSKQIKAKYVFKTNNGADFRITFNERTF